MRRRRAARRARLINAIKGSEEPTVVTNKETIIKEREIIKIKCPYCGTVYNHSETNCPTCKSPNK